MYPVLHSERYNRASRSDLPPKIHRQQQQQQLKQKNKKKREEGKSQRFLFLSLFPHLLSVYRRKEKEKKKVLPCLHRVQPRDEREKKESYMYTSRDVHSAQPEKFLQLFLFCFFGRVYYVIGEKECAEEEEEKIDTKEQKIEQKIGNTTTQARGMILIYGKPPQGRYIF